MKTNFFYLAVAIATTSLFCYSESAGAQAIIVEEDVSVTEVVPTKPRYYSDSHKNNWFISIGAGGQTFFDRTCRRCSIYTGYGLRYR